MNKSRLDIFITEFYLNLHLIKEMFDCNVLEYKMG